MYRDCSGPLAVPFGIVQVMLGELSYAASGFCSKRKLNLKCLRLLQLSNTGQELRQSKP